VDRKVYPIVDLVLLGTIIISGPFESPASKKAIVPSNCDSRSFSARFPLALPGYLPLLCHPGVPTLYPTVFPRSYPVFERCGHPYLINCRCLVARVIWFLDGLIATGEKIEKIIRDEPNNSTVINIKRVSPTGAMHNMKRGTGVWCAIVVGVHP